MNLIVATGNNNYAMSRAVEEVAKRYVDGADIKEGALNRIEAAIRAYDPCLSCSTHALGQMPLELVILDAAGRELRRVRRRTNVRARYCRTDCQSVYRRTDWQSVLRGLNNSFRRER